MLRSFFDIVDENDKPLAKVASYDEVHRLGLWHRGVHAIIYTPDREVVMQKRSLSLAYHPGDIEISAGGGVDAGESPEQAVIREIREELGLAIKPDNLRFIGKTKFNHRTKTQRNHTFIYSYAIRLPKSELKFKTNPEETGVAFLIGEQKLRRALRTHRIKNFGKISSLYAYWQYLLDAI